MRWSNILVIFALIGLGSCIDPFVPETADYDGMIFMECLFSDDSTEATLLYISKTVAIVASQRPNGSNIPEPVSGAMAYIVDGDNGYYPFFEPDPGTYRLVEELRPIEGQKYHLLVTIDGTQFRSTEEMLHPAAEVDSITYAVDRQQVLETMEVYEGYRFQVSTHEDHSEAVYYRWDMKATFQYTVPYEATHVWDGRQTRSSSNAHLRTCWKTKNIVGIFIDNTLGLVENKLTKTPLHFESQYGDALSERYALLVKQRRISKEAWTFWNDLDQLVNQNGGLYDIQPFRTQGNVFCVSDNPVYVAGIFEVASVTEKRSFFNKPAEFENIPVRCVMDTVGTEELPWDILPPGTWVTEDFYSGEFLTSFESCYDCTVKGGETNKPPFWIH